MSIRTPVRRVGRRLRATIVVAAALSLAVTGCSSASDDDTASGAAKSKEDIVLAEAVRTLSNPYHANWVKGGQFFADSVGMKVQVLTDEADSQKQLAQIRSLLAGDKTVVLNVDPNTSSDTQAIVQAVKDAGGYVVTQWNKPDGLLPWDVGDNWVAHISFDGTVGGYDIAKKLFEAMGGSGGIIALQGILDNVPAKQRFAGLKKALGENPNVKLLDQQTAQWNRNTAFQVTQTLLAKHSGQVKGVWAANDDMALGALQALKAAGLQGKVPVVGIDAVPEALQEIKSGASGYVATVSSDAFWQGGVGLALGYQAAMGELNVAEQDHANRAFYGKQFVIDPSNVDQYLKAPEASAYASDWKDPYARIAGPITN